LDHEKIVKGTKLILEGIGEDPDRPGLKETGTRCQNDGRTLFRNQYLPGQTGLYLFSGRLSGNGGA